MKSLKYPNNFLVRDFMTTNYLWETEDADLNQVIELMSENKIRHLPILDKKHRPIGIISERDTQPFQEKEWGHKFQARDIMKKTLLVVWYDSPLKYVCSYMAKKKVGSAIVVNESRKVVGIFTSIDALFAIHEILGDEEDNKGLVGLSPFAEA